MSIMDSRWQFWDDQALTTAEKSHTNGNVIDLEEYGVTDESLAHNLIFNIKVGTGFTGMASGVMISLITSDSASFASGNQCIISFGSTSVPILVAELAAGAVFSASRHIFNLKKYLGAFWEPVSEAGATGKLDCWAGLEPLSPLKVQKAPDGYTIA